MRLAFLLVLATCSKPTSPVDDDGPCRGHTECASGACVNGTCARAAGASCRQDAECASGRCEGSGCDDASFSGRCGEPQRECTPDHVEFCLCNGTTGGYSSRCPPARYRHEGACTPVVPTDAANVSNDALPTSDAGPIGVAPVDGAPADAAIADAQAPVDAARDTKGKLADGRPCRAATACASGFCQVTGCASSGVCASPGRPGPCTPDIKYFCGCDGRDLTGSSTCPPLNYRHRGKCNAPEGRRR